MGSRRVRHEGLLAGVFRPALFLLAKQAADGGLDALLLWGFVQRALADRKSTRLN